MPAPGDHFRSAVTVKRLVAGQHLVEHAAEREHVAAMVRWLSLRLLRRHVRGRAEDHAHTGHHRGLVIVGDCGTLGDIAPVGSSAFANPKSSTFTGAVRADLDVRRLEVAVDDALLVRGFEGLGNLLGDGQGLVDGNRPLCDAVGERRRPRPAPSRARSCRRFLETVNLRDVRVVQGREQLGLTLEPREAIRIVREDLGQDFDGDLTPEVGVRRAVHFAHAAHTDLAVDFVRAEARAGGQCQTVGGLYVPGGLRGGNSSRL